MAGVPARPPQPAGPAHPPEAVVTAVPPVSPELAKAPKSAVALLAEAAAMTPAVTPPEAEDPQWEDVVLPS